MRSLYFAQTSKKDAHMDKFTCIFLPVESNQHILAATAGGRTSPFFMWFLPACRKAERRHLVSPATAGTTVFMLPVVVQPSAALTLLSYRVKPSSVFSSCLFGHVSLRCSQANLHADCLLQSTKN